eukprot:scaffold26663_cov134-Isochrysis_galbana.AAC.1
MHMHEHRPSFAPAALVTESTPRGDVLFRAGDAPVEYRGGQIPWGGTCASVSCGVIYIKGADTVGWHLRVRFLQGVDFPRCRGQLYAQMTELVAEGGVIGFSFACAVGGGGFASHAGSERLLERDDGGGL